jgi:hypothetical protein
MATSDSGLLNSMQGDEGKARPVIPPGPQFWRTYSPNGELPFSGLGSFLVHGLALLILLGGIVAWISKTHETSVSIEPIADGPTGPVGGSGNSLGIGANPGILTPQDVGEPLVTPQDPSAQLDPSTPDFKPDQKPVRLESDVNPANAKTKTGEKSQARMTPNLANSLKGVPGKGSDGPGFGPGVGPGWGGRPLSERQQRWRMIFSTHNGNDYLRQLNALGAILRVDRNNKSYLIRNLSERPAQPQQDDADALHRIYWVDDDLESRESVAQALQLGWTPERIYAYFPKSLEDKLVQKELEYGRKYGRAKEEDIAETHFKIEFARGAPVISVVYQEGKR